jgi:hypothetical protein
MPSFYHTFLENRITRNMESERESARERSGEVDERRESSILLFLYVLLVLVARVPLCAVIAMLCVSNYVVACGLWGGRERRAAGRGRPQVGVAVAPYQSSINFFRRFGAGAETHQF